MVRITQSQTKYLREEILELLEFPPIKLPKLSGYAIRCWGYKGSIISHPKLAILHPAISILQHITKKLRKSFTSTFEKHPLYSYGNTPEHPPQYWVASRLSHQQLHKRDFRCWRTHVFENYNDKIVTTTPRSSTPRDTATTPKCQEAPRTMFSSQNHRNVSKIPA